MNTDDTLRAELVKEKQAYMDAVELLGNVQDEMKTLRTERDQLKQQLEQAHLALREVALATELFDPADTEGTTNESIISAVYGFARAYRECVQQLEQAVGLLDKHLRLSSTIEVLGEWEAQDINHSIRKSTRAKVDAIEDECGKWLSSPSITPIRERLKQKEQDEH